MRHSGVHDVRTSGGVGAMSTLSEFARENQLALTRFAFLLSNDRQHAEDLVQDVLTAMFRRFGDTLPVNNPVAYARAAVVNAQLSRARRRSFNETPVEMTDVTTTRLTSGLGHGRYGDDPAGHDLDATIADRQALLVALHRLSPRSRAAVVLRYYYDLSVTDVARTLGCREGTAASLLSRAVAALRTDTTLGAQL